MYPILSCIYRRWIRSAYQINNHNQAHETRNVRDECPFQLRNYNVDPVFITRVHRVFSERWFSLPNSRDTTGVSHLSKWNVYMTAGSSTEMRPLIKIFYSAILSHIFFMRDHFSRIYTLRLYNSRHASSCKWRYFLEI